MSKVQGPRSKVAKVLGALDFGLWTLDWIGLLLFLLALPVLAQAPQSAGPSGSLTAPRRMVYEGVIGDQGKTIGTTILLEVSGTSLSGWLQHNHFQHIDSGSLTDSSITFTAGGNTYAIDRKNSRISYSGPDGSGQQRVVQMDAVRGFVYRMTEESDYGRTMTLRMPDGERDFLIEQPPAVWKREGPPIEQFSRLEELVGKTATFWRTRMGGAYTIEVIEEPEGMNLLAKLPKEKKGKKKK